ncbi:hypothetical protein tinsulaeT_27000 [Thalassotalea insulae]|uniref:Anti-sigma factor n=1 Tax=Thalassotalea insulae TaxID=2056778 RepID=A0ABQ6GXV9_9GAMM|nr:hypothetical protein [Thalassotalea insulae]GLX79360.1 hypothetical protein tinsulaeT_27000 [Thalassotalea insulae]
MSNSKDTDLERKFSQWLEHRTSEGNQTSDEHHFADDNLWQERQAVANHLAHHADTTEQKGVPAWDRGATFVNEKPAWWQWQGLSAFSFAFSCLAIAMVLLKVELVVKPEGIMLSFAGNHQQQQLQQEQQLAAMLDQRLQAFASEQQVVLANYAADIKVKQQQSNLELASYIMGASRQERKEDIADFIKYINEQWSDDQYKQNIKFRRLEQAIKYRNTKLDNGLGLQSQPADWTTEE